jgi:hypothetical protein
VLEENAPIRVTGGNLGLRPDFVHGNQAGRSARALIIGLTSAGRPRPPTCRQQTGMKIKNTRQHEE